MDNKTLIRQYVDTGVSIPEYQFNQLSNNDKRTYLRKRAIASKQGSKLDEYEFNLLDNQSKLDYLLYCINKYSYIGFRNIMSTFKNKTLNDIFDILLVHYKTLEFIPEFVISSLMGEVDEENTHIINKLIEPKNIYFLTTSNISQIVNNNYFNNKNEFINLFLSNNKLKEKLVYQNYIYFLRETNDIKIVDRILTPDFINNSSDTLINHIQYAKLKKYIATKLINNKEYYNNLRQWEQGKLNSSANGQ